METRPRSLCRGFVIESANVPSGFGAHLEREGLAGMTALTLHGMYLEPRATLGETLRAFERTGAQVAGVRPSGPTRGLAYCRADRRRFQDAPFEHALGRVAAHPSGRLTCLPGCPLGSIFHFDAEFEKAIAHGIRQLPLFCGP